MNYVKQTFWLASMAAVALVGTMPAQADSPDTTKLPQVNPDNGVATVVAETVKPAGEAGVSGAAPSPAQTVNVAQAPVATEANLLAQPATAVSQPAPVTVNTTNFQAIPTTESFQTPTYNQGVDVAQVSRGSYGSVSPAYLGIGGNLGIGDADSAVGDFGFAVISKISLGPRFSVRPSFLLSERFSNFSVPLTFNLNTMQLAGFRFQPYLGAGVDIPFNGNTALLVNAGADIPISRDFTLNTNVNWRVTSGFALGASFGLGYNFPFIFE